MDGLELVFKVSIKEIYIFGDLYVKYKVVVMDFGIKQNIFNSFVECNCYMRIFLAKMFFEKICEWGLDGYFMFNGFGDFVLMDYVVQNVKVILEEDKLLFGICLGYQILVLVVDILIYKMYYGYCGINYLVKNLVIGKCEIIS